MAREEVSLRKVAVARGKGEVSASEADERMSAKLGVSLCVSYMRQASECTLPLLLIVIKWPDLI